MENNSIIVVTGLPRSGTSLLMQILQSMGIELFTDNSRPPDKSNSNAGAGLPWLDSRTT